MKTLKTILLITGVLVAALAWNTIFAQRNAAPYAINGSYYNDHPIKDKKSKAKHVRKEDLKGDKGKQKHTKNSMKLTKSDAGNLRKWTKS